MKSPESNPIGYQWLSERSEIRAVRYLHAKESKSSHEIEREKFVPLTDAEMAALEEVVRPVMEAPQP